MEGLIVLTLLAIIIVWALNRPRLGRVERRLVDVEATVKILEQRLKALGRSRQTEDAPRAAAPPVGDVTPPSPQTAEPGPAPPSRPVAPPARVLRVEPVMQYVEFQPTPPPAPPPPAARAPRPADEAPRRRMPDFDWESLLGLRGAAWAGGIALVIAGILLAKLAIERGFITPELRVALLLLAGVGGLVWAEVSRRRGYGTTANAVSGAGVALLYIAFFAAHSRYHLLPLAPTFALMALVTAVAGLLAIRHNAIVVAGLGLLGGFATPLALSSGTDNPVGLFGYLILLNVGLFTVIQRMRWPNLAAFALAGTVLIEVLWFTRFMAPGKTLVGLGAFLALGLVYLAVLVRGREPAQSLVWTGALGAMVPFAFAVVLASDPVYAAQWPLLFGYVGLLAAALIVVALVRNQLALLLGAALATAITLPLWAFRGLEPDALWGPTLSAIGLTVLLNLPARLAGRLAPGVLAESRFHLEVAGLATWVGLGLYGIILIRPGLGERPSVFLVLLASLTGLLLERGRAGRIRGVVVAGSLGLALLTQVWFFQHTTMANLSQNLAVPALLSLALSLASAHRGPRPSPLSRSAAVDLDDDEWGVVGASAVAITGLFVMVDSGGPWAGNSPWAPFAALAVALVIWLVSVLRRDWTELLLPELLVAAGFSTFWQMTASNAAGATSALAIYLALYVGFLALPFAVPRSLAPTWAVRATPWVASALAGPAFFLVLYRAVVAGWGKAWIGLLPVAMAAASVAALAGVARGFPAGARDPEARRRRLDYLALFAAVALGFIALAIPLQVDRQWITLGWALEAAAVWWLFGRLPHSGLKFFGAALFTAVGARLLVNPAVFRYQERGLPIVNWLLYTYGVPALCAFFGAWLLARAEGARPEAPAQDLVAGDRRYLAPAAGGLGLLLVFWLVNLEIIDYFSAGRYVDLGLERHLARDLTMSVAWGVYALVLLVIGLWRGFQPLRFASLAVLLLTVAKVFLYDLAALEGVHRILSFLGLGLSLILVSLLYQRFVFRRREGP